MITRFLILVLLGASLSACGGSVATTPVVTPPSTPEPEPDPVPEPEPVPIAATSSEMQSARNLLIATHSPISYTNPSALQTSGALTYDGYLGGVLANADDQLTDSMIGEMALTVTFNNSNVVVTGDASNFRDEDNAILTGTLVFSGGVFDRNGDPDADATFTMTANGTLVDDQGRPLVFGTQLEGDFFGTTYGAIGGDVLGRVTYNGSSQDFDGLFIAAR